MILSVTFSKPVKNISDVLGENYTRVKVKLLTSSSASVSEAGYFCEFYTEKQVFHKKLTASELDDFLAAHVGTTFKSVVKRTETEEIQILANKKGKITEIRRPLAKSAINDSNNSNNNNPNDMRRNSEQNNTNIKRLLSAQTSTVQNRRKNYILQEGIPVPFLVHLGVQTAEGKVISSKYDKFKQINRFLEFINDILDDVLELKRNAESSKMMKPVKIVDFGSGKSYLTFAVHYFLTEIKGLDCEIVGLDLKKDVIEYCNSIVEKLRLKNINFRVGDIADYGEESDPDIVITLHACDTATDFALDYALRHNTKGILSVPCCQHELNLQLKTSNIEETSELSCLKPILKYGLIKEKFSALLTDAIRGEILESAGYKVQMLEFIDEESTPKNLLIRAVKNRNSVQVQKNNSRKILESLKLNQTLFNLTENLSQ